MAIDPLTLSMLIGGAQKAKPVAIGAGLPIAGEYAQMRAVTKDTALDERTAQRIADLERRAQLDALGLTPEQMQAMRAEMQRATAASRRAGEARAGMAMAGAGAGSGEQLSRAIAEEAALQQQQQQIAESLAAADLKRIAEEEEELEALIAQQAQREVDKRAARADFVTGSADIIGEFAGISSTTGEFSEQDTKATADKFGVSDEKAREYLKFMSEYPEFFEAI